MRTKSRAPTICVVGPKGSGKSTLIAQIMNANPGTFLVLDPVGQFANMAVGMSAAPPWRISPGAVHAFPRDTPMGDICALACWYRDCTVVLDETDVHVEKNRPLPSDIAEVVHRGRHYNVASICGAQRFAQVHTEIVANSSHLFLFGAHLGADLDRMRRELGAEEARHVRDLAQFQYLWINFVTRSITKGKTIP